METLKEIQDKIKEVENRDSSVEQERDDYDKNME